MTDTTISKYDISIVIVTFRNQSHIEQCLLQLSDSLRGLRTQLIVIDNNSPDDTAVVLNKVVSSGLLSFADLRLIENDQNTGFTCAVNQGLAYCTGGSVLILNPDIFVTPDVFTALLPRLADENMGVVAPQLCNPDGSVQQSCRRFPGKRDVLFELLGLARLFSGNPSLNRWKMPDFDHQSTRPVDQPQGAFLLARRVILQKVGVLDERFRMFFSDVDWCRRIWDAGYKIMFISDVSVVHLKGASIYQERDRMIVSSHRSFVDYFIKYDQSGLQRFTTKILALLLLMALIPRMLVTRIKS